MNASKFSRRRFLEGLGCASLGSTTLFSSLVHLGAISSASGQTLAAGDDYRALVCILLAGGADSFNMLIPTESSEYGEYQAIRADLALNSQALLPIESAGSAGRTFALHPALAEVQGLYRDGNLAFVANVGTLVEPVTLGQINGGSARLPLGLYSHADQIAQWQTSLPDQRAATGWGGRLADLLKHRNADQRVSMNISLGGSNVFQAGLTTTEFAVEANGEAAGVFGYGESDPFNTLLSSTLDSMLNARYRNIFEAAYAERFRGAIESNRFFQGAVSGAAVQTPFGSGTLAQSLRTVARTISARDKLGARRQTFFLVFGGWDHHDEVLVNQQRMLPIVSQSLAEFYAALDELGMQDNVTTFTISDFGRTLTSNGRGSDHGWGGNQMVMGGAVKGGRIYGEYPRLFAGNALDTGRGRLIPTTSVDEYFAELALWFGVDRSALDQVLPNIGRFYAAGAEDPPLGFLLGGGPGEPPNPSQPVAPSRRRYRSAAASQAAASRGS